MDTFALVEHILSTNEPPSATETRQIRTALPLLDAEVEKTLAEQARIQQHLNLLLDQQSKYRAALIPIRHNAFPSEMLAKIFLHVIESDGAPSASERRRGRERLRDNLPEEVPPRTAPLTVSWVCRFWRDVALATPSLWTRFALELEHADSRDNEAVLAAWLDRSGSLPIHISVRLDPHIRYIYPWDPVPILARVAANLHRFDTLVVSLGYLQDESSDWKNPAFGVVPFLPSLHKVDYRVHESLPDTGAALCVDWVKRVISAKSSPNLRELVWNASIQPLRDVPLGNLLNLTILDFLHTAVDDELLPHACRESDLFSILNNAPRLEHCHACLAPPAQGDQQPFFDESVHLPRLKELYLESSGYPIILQALTVPNLTSLTILVEDDDENPTSEGSMISSFWKMLEHSACPLTKLTLECITVDDLLRAGKAHLSLLDNINTLHLRTSYTPTPSEGRPGLQGELLKMLTLKVDALPICPGLEELDLSIEFPKDHTSLFEEMVKSRTSGQLHGDSVKKLRSLSFEAYVHSPYEEEDEIFEPLELPSSLTDLVTQLEQDGVSVEYTVHTP